MSQTINAASGRRRNVAMLSWTGCCTHHRSPDPSGIAAGKSLLGIAGSAPAKKSASLLLRRARLDEVDGT